jgi:hypothetical protein
MRGLSSALPFVITWPWNLPLPYTFTCKTVLGPEVASVGDEWKMNMSVTVTICAGEDLTRIAQAYALVQDCFFRL